MLDDTLLCLANRDPVTGKSKLIFPVAGFETAQENLEDYRDESDPEDAGLHIAQVAIGKDGTLIAAHAVVTPSDIQPESALHARDIQILEAIGWHIDPDDQNENATVHRYLYTVNPDIARKMLETWEQEDRPHSILDGYGVGTLQMRPNSGALYVADSIEGLDADTIGHSYDGPNYDTMFEDTLFFVMLDDEPFACFEGLMSAVRYTHRLIGHKTSIRQAVIDGHGILVPGKLVRYLNEIDRSAIVHGYETKLYIVSARPDDDDDSETCEKHEAIVAGLDAAHALVDHWKTKYQSIGTIAIHVAYAETISNDAVVEQDEISMETKTNGKWHLLKC